MVWSCLSLSLLWFFIGQSIWTSKGSMLDDTKCSLADLEPSRVLWCLDEQGIPIVAESEVPTGSSCDIICPYKEEKAWAVCEEGEWNTNSISYCRTAVTKHRERSKRWFGIFMFAALVRFSCLFGGCGVPTNRDNTPPRLTCPPHQVVIAEILQRWKVVTWTVPTAKDDRDGKITPTREGKGPGDYFSSGDTTVGYYARDKSGNMARCTFTITVTVVRCPWPSRLNNGYFICHPSDDTIYGSTCKFGCYPGYQLVGNSQLRCLIDGNWNLPVPYCEQKRCAVLPPAFDKLKYKCTDGNKFRSICTYSCTSGYDITSGMSRVRVCTAYGFWRGSEPTCTDTDPPKLVNCSHTVYAFADRNSTTGVVTWTEPTTVDNHDDVVNVVKVGSVSPGDRLPAGSYKIIYKATDAAGNQAQECVTNVILKVLTCPVIHPTPFLSVTCPWGAKYGSHCEFDCDLGSVRNGSKIVACEKRGGDNFAHWTWGDKQPHCQVIQKCLQEPNVPQNGALACDYWLGGKVCQMLCKEGYDVKINYNTVDMLVCGDSGQWLPTGSLPLPDCTRSYLAERGILRMSIEYYFSGDCTNSAVQDEIKTLFITILSESPYKDACLLHANECNVDNVQVLCGQAARKKRSESSTLWIDFDITATFEDATFTESFSKFRAHQTDLINKIAEAKTSGSLDIDTAGGGVMEATGIGNAYVILKCPENMLPSYRSTSCVQCAEGTFYDKTSDNCEMCPKGTYQPIAGQSECLPCPPYRTTKAKGSQHLSQCEDGCEPGSWSPSGTSQCSLCAVGTFSDAYGKTKCTSCPGSKSTIAEGANNIDQCKDFDLWLTDVSSETSADFSVLGFKDTIITFWFQRDISSHIFRIEIMDTDKDTVASYMTFGSEIKIGKQGDDRETNCVLDNEQWHSYHLRHSNESTELYVDGKLKEKSNLTVAYTGNMTISLKGKGMVSRLNIWTVNSTSFTRILNISQKCDVDETGDLLKWKAFEFTLNDNIFKQSPSECDDVDSCISSPCLNGECRDILGGHECHCYYGFSGDNCEENIDDCIDHACENNATCVDGAANYTCQCQYGYKGELCEIAIVDGSWGDWGEWSSCSVTCGNGTQQRSRICNDPAPDDGGLACPDNSTQIRTCSEKTCPECNVLKPLQNAIWTCSNHSDSINCTIKCAAGYDFDHEVKPFYFCGKDTFYQWDFQTDDNPDAKLPFCSEIKDSQKLKVFYAVKYKDLECESSDISEEVEKDVNEAVQLGLNNIECVSTGVCHKERVTVTDCNRRNRRSALASTAGIDVSLSCDPTLYGTQTCYKMLSDAMNELHALAMNQTLDIDIKGNIYEVNLSSALADSSVSCSSGMIPVRYYCIPCAPGRYFKNEECVKCDYGSYQVSSGQLLCEKCPDDTTTPGRESRSVAECSVKLHNDIYEPLTVVAGVVGGVIFLVLIVTTLLFRRCMVKSKNKEENVHFYPKSCSDSDTPTFDKRQKLQSRLQSSNSVISKDSNHGRHTKGYASSTASSGSRPQSSMSVIKRTYVDDNNIEVIDVM